MISARQTQLPFTSKTLYGLFSYINREVFGGRLVVPLLVAVNKTVANNYARFNYREDGSNPKILVYRMDNDMDEWLYNLAHEFAHYVLYDKYVKPLRGNRKAIEKVWNKVSHTPEWKEVIEKILSKLKLKMPQEDKDTAHENDLITKAIDKLKETKDFDLFMDMLSDGFDETPENKQRIKDAIKMYAPGHPINFLSYRQADLLQSLHDEEIKSEKDTPIVYLIGSQATPEINTANPSVPREGSWYWFTSDGYPDVKFLLYPNGSGFEAGNDSSLHQIFPHITYRRDFGHNVRQIEKIIAYPLNSEQEKYDHTALDRFKKADLIQRFRDDQDIAYYTKMLPGVKNTLELADPHGSSMDISKVTEEIILEGLWEHSTPEEREKYLGGNASDTLSEILARA